MSLSCLVEGNSFYNNVCDGVWMAGSSTVSTIVNVGKGAVSVVKVGSIGTNLIRKTIRLKAREKRISEYESTFGNIKYIKFLFKPYNLLALPFARIGSRYLLEQATFFPPYATCRNYLKDFVIIQIMDPQRTETYTFYMANILQSLPFTACDQAAGALRDLGSFETDVTTIFTESESALGNFGLTSLQNRVQEIKTETEDKIKTKKNNLAYKIVDFIPKVLLNIMLIKIITSVPNYYYPIEFNSTVLPIEPTHITWLCTAIYLIGLFNAIQEPKNS